MQIEDKKYQILQASLEVFGSYGYKKTSMQDIADALGISRPALYQYYKNKEAVFLALVEHTLNLGEQAAIKGFKHSADNFECLLHGIKDMEQVLFGPIFLKPNGKELLTLSKKLAPELMMNFEMQLFDKVVYVLKKALTEQEIDLTKLNAGTADAAKIILQAIDGIKNASNSLEELDRQLNLFLTIFWQGLIIK
ncbi:TetR/AcrR family transcriptional regulator [uncultured Psychrosphaera sp.]|uniref:TetR/AcrR family transcriptional regulator n=1 Tax=uncultured Psychrosphaera sp. TaxID=1403522 RepID=UPI0026138BA0|nr:TetR/AcrR family transcriptional regulator [uncultured Psychrosphaera sp.]